MQPSAARVLRSKSVDLKAQLIKARSTRVVSEAVGEEVVVYDLDTDEAHLLSPNVAKIWRAADGSRNIDQLASVVTADGPEQALSIVWGGLEQLQEKRLLEGVVLFPASAGMSRRAMLKRIGIAAVAIPVITTIVAPTPAAAACAPGRGNVTEGCCSAGACNPGQGLCTTDPNTDGRGAICCFRPTTTPLTTCPTNGKNIQCCSGNCDKNTNVCQ